MRSHDHRRDESHPTQVSKVASSRTRICGGAVLVIALTLSGCAPGLAVSIPQDAPAPRAIATVEPAEHELGIVAVEFDPPLDHAQLAAGGGVSLLVAVENRGGSVESNVTVSARLLDPGAQAGSAELLNETVVLTELAAGQIRTVRFPQVTAFPLLPRYRLEIAVEPAPGEAETRDNFRSYEIAIAGDE